MSGRTKIEKLKLPPKERERGCPRVFVETFGLQIQTNMSLMCEETGGDVWLGGLAVAQYLCREEAAALIRGKRVVELGAGTGYLSLCAAMLGADRVVATDFPMMVDFIKDQISRNIKLMQEKEDEKAKTRKRRTKTTSVASPGDALSTSWQRLRRVSVLALDWDQPVSDKIKQQLVPVDVVLATDLLYQCSNVAPLLAMLELICTPGTIVIIGQSHREFRDEEKVR